jgi:CO/xanthine dehydrogenase FAD-binding subunit
VRDPLEPGELIVEIEVPPLPPNARVRFAQFEYGVAVAQVGVRVLATPGEGEHHRALIESLIA